MKKSFKRFVVAATAALVVFGVNLFAGEAAKGSIHPQGQTKPADLPSLAKVSFQQALDVAVAKVPGSVIKAELEVEDGCLMYSFEIVGQNKKITEVEIDAGTGKVLDTEDETAESEKTGKKGDSKD